MLKHTYICSTVYLYTVQVLHYTMLHCNALPYTTLHYTMLHYPTLHCTTLQCTTLHYTTPLVWFGLLTILITITLNHHTTTPLHHTTPAHIPLHYTTAKLPHLATTVTLDTESATIICLHTALNQADSDSGENIYQIKYDSSPNFTDDIS